MTRELLSLAYTVGNALREHGWMLTTAESCTGGLVAAAITEIAGSSGWFERTFVTYSNEAKMEMLGVSGQTLDEYGAVSEETVAEMARGALAHSRADVALAISGIAGPDGGSAQKPVGTVCFAWCLRDGEPDTLTLYLDGDRAGIRRQAASIALEGVLDRLHA